MVVEGMGFSEYCNCALCTHCLEGILTFYSLQMISLEIYTLLQKYLLDNNCKVDYFNVITHSG